MIYDIRIILLMSTLPVVALLAAWLVRQARSRAPLAIERPLMAYLLVAATSSLLQPHAAALPHLVQLAAQVALLLVIMRLAAASVRRFIIIAAGMVVVEALLHLAARATGTTTFWLGSTAVWRVRLLSCDWMTYTQILLLALPIALARSRHSLLWSMVVMSIVFVLFWSGQRAAWLALAAVLLVVALLAQQWRVAAAGATIFLLCCLLWSPLVLADRARYEEAASAAVGRETVRPAITSTMARKSFWRLAGQNFAKNPWIGTGSYRFDSSYGNYRTYHAHNVVVDMAGRYGLAGLICFAWLVIATLKNTPLDSTTIAVLLAFGILSVFGDVFWVLIAGLCTASCVRSPKQPDTRLMRTVLKRVYSCYRFRSKSTV
jgi:O-antigen ligase